MVVSIEARHEFSIESDEYFITTANVEALLPLRLIQIPHKESIVAMMPKARAKVVLRCIVVLSR